MTPNEFKAWFDGFTEAFTGCPTKIQWTRIKARVAEIDGKPVTERIYVDRYLPSYPSYPYWTRYVGGIGAADPRIIYSAGQSAVSNTARALPVTFNSSLAMADLGRAEAQSLAS